MTHRNIQINYCKKTHLHTSFLLEFANKIVGITLMVDFYYIYGCYYFLW